tara:strand:+ start:191 stop:457 length:267 start_codon:yes stop_codon:yes gene_type:complete
VEVQDHQEVFTQQVVVEVLMVVLVMHQQQLQQLILVVAVVVLDYPVHPRGLNHQEDQGLLLLEDLVQLHLPVLHVVHLLDQRTQAVIK